MRLRDQLQMVIKTVKIFTVITPDVSEDMEELNPPYTAGGELTWSNHAGKQLAFQNDENRTNQRRPETKEVQREWGWPQRVTPRLSRGKERSIWLAPMWSCTSIL